MRRNARHSVGWDRMGENAMEWNRIVMTRSFQITTEMLPRGRFRKKHNLLLVGKSPVGADVFEVWNKQVSLGTSDQGKPSGSCL